MDKRKYKLEKSRSSNQTKLENQKKSKSFETPNTLKEGKDEKGTKIVIGGTSASSKGSDTKIGQIKPPPRPGKKTFLDSVLSILSKSTTGTQYPDREDPKTKRKPKEKKLKYRSKVLNYLEDQVDTNFDVIQHKKDIIQTPSVYSAMSNQEEFKPWELGLPRLVKPDEEELRMKREQNINILVKEVTEGRMEKEKVQEPDKGLYDFFVDLLETTFSVYNMKTDVNRSGSEVSSKVAFEIDENVAEKLKVLPNVPEDIAQKPSKKCDISKVKPWKPDPVIDFYQTSPSYIRKQRLSPKKSRIKSRSVDYVKENQRSYPKGKAKRKLFDRNLRKENLLNLLREQLSVNFNPFDEPPNLYQSLQIIAKNKRENQKTLRFEKSKFDEFLEQSKRRRLRDESIRTSEYSTKKKSQVDVTSEEEASNHSLEVYGFDYEHPYIMKPEKRERNFLFTYHSSSSESDGDIDPYESMS